MRCVFGISIPKAFGVQRRPTFVADMTASRHDATTFGHVLSTPAKVSEHHLQTRPWEAGLGRAQGWAWPCALSRGKPRRAEAEAVRPY